MIRDYFCSGLRYVGQSCKDWFYFFWNNVSSSYREVPCRFHDIDLQLFLSITLSAVWPDLAKFHHHHHFGKYLKIFGNIFLRFIWFWGKFSTLVCYWANFNCWKWRNIENTIWSSGHTVCRRRCSRRFSCQYFGSLFCFCKKSFDLIIDLGR